MKFAYARGGGPLLSWNGGAPQQSRAADAKSLGSLGSTVFSAPTLELPLPGAPEPLGPQHLGCADKPACACRKSLAGFADQVSALPTPMKVAAVGALFLLYRHLKKGRR